MEMNLCIGYSGKQTQTVNKLENRNVLFSLIDLDCVLITSTQSSLNY